MHGLVKTIEGIKLVGNALTFILYKSYFGRDLLNDIVAFAGKSAEGDALKKLSGYDPENLTAEQQAQVLELAGAFRFDSEFVLQFTASLMATAAYPAKPDISDLIMQIPPHWVADKTYISELMEFLSLFIADRKLKGTAAPSGDRLRRRCKS